MTPALLELTYQLADLPDREAYLRTAGVEIARFVPCDDLFWLETDYGAATSLARHGPAMTHDGQLADLVLRAADHPVIHSYLENPSDRNPRRISDVTVTSGWRNTDAGDLLAKPMGRHQLSILTHIRGPAGHAWGFGRAGSDFTTDDLDTAQQLLPILTLLDRLYGRRPENQSFSSNERNVERSRLTRREIDILTLLARGLTADAIGTMRRISGRTVRKHLQNAYAKLGCHDRLMAVDRARALGILPPGLGCLPYPEAIDASL
jgi:DNA-binding CsgD family transcriptional regulator